VKSFSAGDIRARKGGTPLVCLTAYGTPVARLIDPHVDLILVGDSLGMVLYGLDGTLSVTLEQMIAHGAAVTRGAKRACVIVDLPFGSYQESPEQAFRNAAKVMAGTGCAGVKLEGGRDMAETIAFLTARGVPVLGHIGLMPQMVATVGGFLTQGRTPEEAAAILADAKAVEAAGAFATVVEATTEAVARQVTKELAIPTIGIGASAVCDGQILVTDDLLGLSVGNLPSFAKRYAALNAEIDKAVGAYAMEVRDRAFPPPKKPAGGNGGTR